MATPSVYITKTSAFLPNPPVANEAMEGILGQVGERPSRARRLILRSNQILNRHYAIDPVTGKHNYTNAQLNATAVRNLFDDSFTPAQLCCLTASTTIADQLIPSHASMVHGELGAPACEVIGTTGVCACGMSALKYAYMSVLSQQHPRAVASASEAASYTMQAQNFAPEIEHQLEMLAQHPEIAFEKDFLRWMLSDGAGAFLLESQLAPGQPALKIEWLDILSYANEMEACMYAGAQKNTDGSLTGWQQVNRQQCQQESFLAVKQDVKQLNANITHFTVEKPLRLLQEKYNLRAEDIDYFLPHYSSAYFRDKLAEGLSAADFDIPSERWFTNLATKGNTGSASIYIMVDELFRSGRLRSGEKLLCYVPESGRFSVAYMLLTVV
jgi:3-oxoacyl-[acyl-carrier-protein] synthase III